MGNVEMVDVCTVGGNVGIGMGYVVVEIVWWGYSANVWNVGGASYGCITSEVGYSFGGKCGVDFMCSNVGYTYTYRYRYVGSSSEDKMGKRYEHITSRELFTSSLKRSKRCLSLFL